MVFFRPVLLYINIAGNKFKNHTCEVQMLADQIFQDSSRYQSLGKTNPSNPLNVEDYADDVLLGMLDPKVIRSVLQEFLGSKP